MSKSKYWPIKQSLMQQVFLFASVRPDLIDQPVRVFSGFFNNCLRVEDGQPNKVLQLKNFLKAIELESADIPEEDLSEFIAFLKAYENEPKAVRALNILELMRRQNGWQPHDNRDGWVLADGSPPNP